MIEFGI